MQFKHFFLGEEIFHIYELKNRGPSTIQEAEVYILWPSFDESKKHLLYLLGVQSEPSDRVVCKSVANINPLYVKVINKLNSYQLDLISPKVLKSHSRCLSSG